MLNSKEIYKLFKNRIFTTLFLSILIFWFLLLSIYFNLFYSLDKKLQYSIHNLVNPNNSFTEQVAVIAIDEKTLSELWRFPFDRKVYIKLIDNLNNLWVSVIGFDIIFTDKTDKKTDRDFLMALSGSTNVVLGWTEKVCDKYVDDNVSIRDLGEWECKKKSKWGLILPLQHLWSWTVDNAIFTIWNFSPIVDEKTKIVYSFSPIVWFSNKVYNHFTIALLRAYYFKQLEEIWWEWYKYNTWLYNHKKWIFEILGKIQFKLSSKNSEDILINYTPTENITTYSFIDLYNSKSEAYKNIKNNKLLNWRIVIIWTEAKGIKDIFLTPLWITYWVNIHANILNTFFNKKFIIYFSYKIELIILFLVIFLSIYLFLDKKTYVWFLWNLGIIIFLIIISWWLSINNYLLNYPVEILLWLFLWLTFSNLVKFLIENRNKKILVKALWEYISKDIANKILTDSWDLKLDWENKKISIFFSDIAWFTTISEKMNAEKLVEFLREYLWAMSNIIMDERWFINKYEWDAIMALYWVFWYEDMSTYDNCKAALLQQARLKVLNKWWEKQFWEVLKVRMWIHTWNAIIWNIGAKWRKMEYTALWDSVNLASRLEWVNKYYWTYICVSENVVNEVWDKFEFRKLDKIRVKWKNIPIEIYELLWEKWKISDLKKDIKVWFEKALELYFNKEFKKAWEIFKKLWEIWDPASLVFSRRCFKFEISWVKEDWDWVWTMEEK